MSIQSSLLAVRAIGAAFANKLWWVSVVWVLIVGIILVTFLIWLTGQNSWWWLLAAPIGIGLSITAAILAVFRLLMNYVRPEQTLEQKSHIKLFVEKLQFASEITSAPKVIMLFRTIRSIAAPKSDTYLQNILETKDLRKDFVKIAQSFEK